jgi:hypothetical protein
VPFSSLGTRARYAVIAVSAVVAVSATIGGTIDLVALSRPGYKANLPGIGFEYVAVIGVGLVVGLAAARQTPSHAWISILGLLSEFCIVVASTLPLYLGSTVYSTYLTLLKTDELLVALWFALGLLSILPAIVMSIASQQWPWLCYILLPGVGIISLPLFHALGNYNAESVFLAIVWIFVLGAIAYGLWGYKDSRGY